MSDLISIINEAINEILPGLNKDIQETIRKDGLDPMLNVTSGHVNAGSINLGICTAHAEASYTAKQLSGLSSLSIKEIKINGVSGELASFSTGMSLALVLGGDLKCNIGGKVSAGCGFIHKSEGLSGKVNASGITLSATGVLKGGASLKEQKATLQSMQVSSFNLKYKNVSLSIDGLGIFNPLLETITSLITGIIEQYLTNTLSQVIENKINEEMKNLLPLTVKIPIPALT